MNVFLPADILIPEIECMEKWSVIACDQFSAQPEYWEKVRRQVADAPSTVKLILPEAELGSENEEAQIEAINEFMCQYLNENIFKTYEKSFVYVERTLRNGKIRCGLVGAIDLEAYDYTEGSMSEIRATEKTVIERIPPRVKIRRDAKIELPHVLMLCDDEEKCLIEWVGGQKEKLEKIYEFDLMENGGHIAGWLVQGALVEQFEERIAEYTKKAIQKYGTSTDCPMVFAVGDGNHSLATAKACYEEYKRQHPEADTRECKARYALVELENIHADALKFAPIYRIIMNTDPQRLLDELKKECCAEDGYPVTWYAGEEYGTIYLKKGKSQLSVAILQRFLDGYLKNHEGEIDYIHGSSVLKELAQEKKAIGFMLPAMEKTQLFSSVMEDGSLPRKTFSMGHACEKRYYLEARMIK